MSWESFIARRIYFDKDKRREVSPPAVRLAVAGVALGLAVMIISVAIVVGFKHEIRDKVIGFGSHVNISAFSSNTSYETPPIEYSEFLQQILQNDSDIARIEPYATKPSILKTDSQYMGVVVKGVMPDYDWEFYARNLVAGTIPQITDSTVSTQIVISQHIASQLQLNVGDDVLAYFVDNNRARARKYNITGIYKTDLADYDNLFILGDARQLQQINGWDANQYSGIEMRLHDFDKLDEVNSRLYRLLIASHDSYGSHYYVRSVRELNPVFFGWLSLLDMNVWIILILMAIVAGFTMISGLLIIILENTSMIGTLKALGADNRSIRQTFLQVASYLVGRGMLWGNVIGLAVCLLQQHLHILKLNPEAYYIAYVPIEINIWHIILLNIATLSVSMLMLVGPSYIVSLIRPAKSIKFE
ncbi:MAG: ABC transporter permease [Bacteroidaceae bacterium]|nr:ABC transporter permease [Bacteroidaceae bacterium]